jgi:hypothetical protein
MGSSTIFFRRGALSLEPAGRPAFFFGAGSGAAAIEVSLSADVDADGGIVSPTLSTIASSILNNGKIF